MNIIKAIRDKLAGVDEVVPVLVLFEMIYLGVGMLIIWAFLPVDKPKVALGFAIGVGFSVLSSIQNSMILKRALSRGKKKSASAGMVIFMLARIAGISLIVILALKYEFCSAIAVLVGVLAIQAGVYFEPAFRKRREKKKAALNKTSDDSLSYRDPDDNMNGGLSSYPLQDNDQDNNNEIRNELSSDEYHDSNTEDDILPDPYKDEKTETRPLSYEERVSQGSDNEEEL